MAQELLRRLNENIIATTNDPSFPLETRLFEEAEIVLPQNPNVTEDEQTALTVKLAALLPTLQQDPSPATALLRRLLGEHSFGDILRLLGNASFTDGLATGDHMVSFNILVLSILSKAASNPADAATVATLLDTMLALVRLWLCTSDTGVASQASKLLLDLLKVDQEQLHAGPNERLSGGQGLVWRRIFGDKDVYATFFEACSLTGPSNLDLSKSQKSIAQARLLEWLPIVGAMDWDAISGSHHKEIESVYYTEGGLLDFAALKMVDQKDDVLMYRCLVDFFSDILRSTKLPLRIQGTASDSPGLRYLITHGLHAGTAAVYLQLPGAQLDPVESMFLYGPAANYIAAYATHFPEHFLASQMPLQVLDRLRVALDLSPARWAHSESPKHDLHLLASIPRRTLLRSSPGMDWQSNPLSLLPTKSTNPDVLNTLATVFHGPDRDVILTDTISAPNEPDASTIEEAAQARALYYHYIAYNPRFFADLATHADTVALKDLALAALNCMLAIITANWSTVPEQPLLPNARIATPATGHLALLAPPALEYALPYLLKPPQTFANLVGGRGDAESAAYKIASAKFDALRALRVRLLREVDARPGEGYEDILATIEKRLVDGPMSREGEIGGRIGTLEL